MSVKVIEKIRKLLGLTKVEMAEALGRSKQSYRVLTTATKINISDIETIRRLAKDADVSDRELLDLLEEEGKKKKKKYKIRFFP